MAAGQQPVTDTPNPIAAGQGGDVVEITNVGHCYVWVGDRAGASTDTGYPLAPGASETFSTANGVTAIRRSGATVAGAPYSVIAWNTA